jgi:hypothetical protein
MKIDHYISQCAKYVLAELNKVYIFILFTHQTTSKYLQYIYIYSWTLHGCHLLRRLYTKLYFLSQYIEFFIILYNILKIAELDCCQIIILSLYVPSTHA